MEGATRQLANRFRDPASLPVDIERVALDLGVRPEWQTMVETVWGATTEAGRVVINSVLTPRRQRFALAHELGHVLVLRGLAPSLNRRYEEQFADQIAREILVPSAHLSGCSEADVDNLAFLFDVETRVVLSQLAAMGYLPAITVWDGWTVICSRCGDVQRQNGCPCTRYRWEIQERARRQPIPA